MKLPRVHKVSSKVYRLAGKSYIDFDQYSHTVCGKYPTEITGHWETVTCKLCLRREPKVKPYKQSCQGCYPTTCRECLGKK